MRHPGLLAAIALLVLAPLPGHAGVSGGAQQDAAMTAPPRPQLKPEQGRAHTAQEALRRNTRIQSLLDRSGPVAPEQDPAMGLIGTARSSGIGLRAGAVSSTRGREIGVEIPLGAGLAVVPGYAHQERDIGLESSEGAIEHAFRIGASLRF